MKPKILVVDDEWNMRNLIKIYLINESFEVDEASNGVDAVRMVEQSHYDVIVLDIMLPDIDGWEVCSTIRKTRDMPILMLTARNDIKDKVFGLEIGADDYLTKPFAPEELVARVNALLRRHKRKIEGEGIFLLFVGDLAINSESREVKLNEHQIDLTPKEFDILYLFAANPNRVFTREILLDSVWVSNEFRDTRAVDTHIKNIREKLRKAGLSFNPIKTVWGVGYKLFRPEDQASNE
ncbi:response regulator transcription factor [Salirhabdus salicampi]|uniref:response regulator transcription factor n=1 Tax=Salirhabdus salicampi TaxID=476102 RepID=UPI0020C32E08|nr:response regulator transcription factor [Salirhabdus salicampi]MCP8616347.1 response regulator transcription factor [Salirhabdus salicampi]